MRVITIMESTIRVGNRQIRYIEQGRGQPVILLHGASLGSSADSFERNLGPLAAAGVRAISVDRPGYGLSDGPSEMTPGGHQKFALDFMDVLGIERAILVGHSQQATIVAGLAFEQPNRVPRVVVVGPGLLPPPASGGGREESEQIDSEPSLEWTREQLKGNLFHHDLITPEAIEMRNRMSRGKAFTAYGERSSGGGAPQRSAGDAEPMWKRVGNNPERFLMLVGRQDRATTGEQADEAHRLFPTLNLVDYEGCRHLVHWDQADDFVRQVVAFVGAGAAVA